MGVIKNFSKIFYKKNSLPSEKLFLSNFLKLFTSNYVLIIVLAFNSIILCQWSNDPYVNLEVAEHGENIHAVPDGNGGAILTFNNFDYNVVTTYLQAIDKYGYLKWNQPKVLINGPGPQNYVQDIFINPDGSLLLGYNSGYSIDTNFFPISVYDPYVQKIDSDGNKLWGEDGIRLNADSTGKPVYAEFYNDGYGGIFGFWHFIYQNNDPIPPDSLFIQHISKDGERLWGDNGIFVDDSTFVSPIHWIVTDDSGGIYVQYQKRNSEYYIRKYDSLGNLSWTLNSAINFSNVLKDEMGGVIVSGVVISSPRKIIINRISSEGEKLWGEEGIVVDDSADGRAALLLLNSDSNIAVFWDTDWWPYDDLFLQRYTPEGEQLWEEHLKVSEFVSQKGRAGIIKSDTNTNIIVWGETKDSTRMYSQKIDSLGNKLWNIDKIIGEGGASFNIITDENGGAINLWQKDPPWGGIYAQQISKNGNLGEVITSVSEDNNTELDGFYLSQNYPNPFNPKTVISYSVKDAGLVKIKVYDILGSDVATLVNETKEAGNFAVEFNPANLPSGVYIYTLQVNGYSESKKMLLMK